MAGLLLRVASILFYALRTGSCLYLTLGVKEKVSVCIKSIHLFILQFGGKDRGRFFLYKHLSARPRQLRLSKRGAQAKRT